VELAEVGSIRYDCVRTFYVWAVDGRAGRAVHSRRLRQPLLLALSLRREREREVHRVVSTEFWLLSISLVERENREQRAERHLSRERETERYVVRASRGR